MKVGDVIRTRNVRSYFGNPEIRGHAEFKAPKGEMFVLLLLGTESKDKPLDPDARLEELGWVFSEED